MRKLEGIRFTSIKESAVYLLCIQYYDRDVDPNIDRFIGEGYEIINKLIQGYSFRSDLDLNQIVSRNNILEFLQHLEDENGDEGDFIQIFQIEDQYKDVGEFINTIFETTD